MIPSTSCLLIDDWENNGNNLKEVTRTIPAGTHTLQLDYYDDGGSAKVKLEIFLSGQFDNPIIDFRTWTPDDGDWQLRQHDLTDYAGFSAVGLRFRLDRRFTSQTNANCNCTASYPINHLVSWWLAELTVIDP